MSVIGGIYGLELPSEGVGYHPSALELTSGRACVSFILEKENPSRVYLPFLCCDTLLAPFLERSVEIQFYSMGRDLCPVELPDLLDDELFLYINFYGVCRKVVDSLCERYGRQLIVDNTQAFFEKSYSDTWSFNSARKFFGVVDGAYVYTPDSVDQTAIKALPTHDDVSCEHLLLYHSGQRSLAYEKYAESESLIDNEIRAMSKLSRRILSSLNYTRVSAVRCENFSSLSVAFENRNKLDISSLHARDSVPICYPLLLDKHICREKLAAQDVFVPTFWREVASRDGGNSRYQCERELTTHLLPLPIDHRLNGEDMERLIGVIENQLE